MRDWLVYQASVFRLFLKNKNLHGAVRESMKFRRWYRYRNTKKGTLDLKIPWLVFDAIDFLESWLSSDMVIFEFGSGGSTLFFASRAKQVISAEHDKAWFNDTREALTSERCTNVDYFLREPEPDIDYHAKSFYRNEDAISSRQEYRGMNFVSYVHLVDGYPDNYFDLVVVDGRVRNSCIHFSIPKIKKNGYLLLDNAERGMYISANPELLDRQKWERKDFTGHFPFSPASVMNTTSLFKKKY